MRQFGLMSALLLLSLSSFACSDEVRIQDVETGSYQYWCLVSRGEWDIEHGPCLCNGVQCALGAVCAEGDNGLTCTKSMVEEQTENDPQDNPTDTESAPQETPTDDDTSPKSDSE